MKNKKLHKIVQELPSIIEEAKELWGEDEVYIIIPKGDGSFSNPWDYHGMAEDNTPILERLKLPYWKGGLIQLLLDKDPKSYLEFKEEQGL